jgi:fused signal recognition particle receptor
LAPYQLIVLAILAAGIQFGLLSAALLIEFSDRKRRPQNAAAPMGYRRAGVAKVSPLPARRPGTVARVPAPSAPPPQPHPEEVEAESHEPPPQGPPEPVITEAAAPPEAAAETAEPLSVSEPSPEATPQAVIEQVNQPPTAAVEIPAAPVRAEPVRLGLGLRKTREGFLGRIRAAITGKGRVDEIYEALEEALIAADVGVDASMRIVEAVRAGLKNDSRPDAIREALKAEIERILSAASRPMAVPPEGEPLVIMLAGVNGAGKTTTVAKLAALFKAERGPVTVAAADTFRAAAIEQLEVWCNRVGADIIKQKQGSDPAAVAFDAVKSARARKAATVLIDTAGRLQTKVNLMEELKKIGRVVNRELPGAPHEAWLVLDATTGQNALSQARQFGEAVALTGVVLAKLDSSAKGGVVIAIADQLKLPVRYVGVGERVEDLRPFDPHEFVEALFENEDSVSASGSYAA